MRIRNAVRLVVLAVISTHAYAQDYKDGPHIGFATSGDVRNEELAYGYQVVHTMNDGFSLELSITRQADEIEERIDTLTIPPNFHIDMEIFALALSGRFSLEPHHRLKLYGGGGFGYYIMKTDAEEVRRTIAADPGSSQLLEMNVDVDNDFGFHLAAGLELELSEHWELFADFRYVWLEPAANLKVVEQFPPPDDSAPFLRTTTLQPDKLEYDHALVRAGFNYRF